MQQVKISQLNVFHRDQLKNNKKNKKSAATLLKRKKVEDESQSSSEGSSGSDSQVRKRAKSTKDTAEEVQKASIGIVMTTKNRKTG